MSSDNMYAPPQSEVRDMHGGSGSVTDAIVNALRKTRPWVLLVAIVGFIFAVITLIASVFMIFMGSQMGGELAGAGDPLGGGISIGVGILYLVFALVYFMASLYLLRYAGAIKRAVTGLNVSDLESALSHQASFWKLMGVLTLLSIILFIVMLVVMGMGGMAFMANSGSL